MKRLTREWVGKAEGDWYTANRELQAREHRNCDAICFHAQQCAEKYLKAILQERNIAFPRTHALELLADLLRSTDPGWAGLRAEMRRLTEAAVALRYPGEAATMRLARRAVETCAEMRQRARLSLGLKASQPQRLRRRGRRR